MDFMHPAIRGRFSIATTSQILLTLRYYLKIATGKAGIIFSLLTGWVGVAVYP